MKEEIQTIPKKFVKADYPRPFVNSLINQYYNKTQEQQMDNEDDYTIPLYFFEEERLFVWLIITILWTKWRKIKGFY